MTTNQTIDQADQAQEIYLNLLAQAQKKYLEVVTPALNIYMRAIAQAKETRNQERERCHSHPGD